MRQFVIGVLSVTVACAHNPSVDASKRWVGSNINELIQQWGPPASTSNIGGGKKLYSWYYGEGVPVEPTPGAAIARTKDCKTAFTVDSSGKVEKWRYEGSGC
jgi:hypothetical protein